MVGYFLIQRQFFPTLEMQEQLLPQEFAIGNILAEKSAQRFP